MRIIGGDQGGRKIHPPSRMPHTRPTTDIAKEGLFNILQHQLEMEEMKTLDLFAGTGNISYELYSRGARDLQLVEKDPVMASFIKKTAHDLGFTGFRILQMDAFKYISQAAEQFDFIFAGPPYALPNIDDLPKLVERKKLLAKNGWFVLEHTTLNNFEGFPLFNNRRNYGTTVFSFFVNKP
jgi:16S rRNA (guanine966-N2)-methyltransferase